MRSIGDLYDKFTDDDDSTVRRPSTTTDSDEEPSVRPMNGFTTKALLNNGEKILSERLVLLKAPTSLVAIVSLPKIKVGTIGIYRSVYNRTQIHNFGYIEETRVVTRLSLYNHRLLLFLNPVLSMTDDNASVRYITTNTIRLVLYSDTKPEWMLLSRGNRIRRGVEFVPSFRSIRRTVVEDGSFTESNGLIAATSARGLIPRRLKTLFTEAIDDDGIVLW